MGMYKTSLMWSFIHTHVCIMCAGYEYFDNTHIRTNIYCKGIIEVMCEKLVTSVVFHVGPGVVSCNRIGSPL